MPSPSITREHVSTLSSQALQRCYQCQKCSVGCPVASASDLLPHQLAQLLILGQIHEALTSSMVWLCVGCETCGQRCPNGINLSQVMDALKQLAKLCGLVPREKGIAAFHQAFLNNIKTHGRIHEATMLADYKLRSGDLFADLALGAKLFIKGKIPLRPIKGVGIQEVKALFHKVANSPMEPPGG